MRTRIVALRTTDLAAIKLGFQTLKFFLRLLQLVSEDALLAIRPKQQLTSEIQRLCEAIQIGAPPTTRSQQRGECLVTEMFIPIFQTTSHTRKNKNKGCPHLLFDVSQLPAQ